MAGTVRISENLSWSTANWVYWGVMDRLIEALADDPAAREAEQCRWLQSMDLPALRADNLAVAAKVVFTLKAVANRCASGELPCSVDGRPLDDGAQQQFKESAGQLAAALASCAE